METWEDRGHDPHCGQAWPTKRGPASLRKDVGATCSFRMAANQKIAHTQYCAHESEQATRLNFSWLLSQCDCGSRELAMRCPEWKPANQKHDWAPFPDLGFDFRAVCEELPSMWGKCAYITKKEKRCKIAFRLEWLRKKNKTGQHRGLVPAGFRVKILLCGRELHMFMNHKLLISYMQCWAYINLSLDLNFLDLKRKSVCRIWVCLGWSSILLGVGCGSVG